MRRALIGVLAATCVLSAKQATPAAPTGPTAQAIAPTNDAPNPYETIVDWARMPAGRAWGSTSAVDIDRDGTSVWVAERCGANSCWDAAKQQMSPLDPVLEFDASGALVTSFGAGLMVFPHGIWVDQHDDIWVTDGQDNLPRRPRGGGAPAGAAAPAPAPPAKLIGHQVFKFDKRGKLLMTLGKPGGNQPGQPADPASFYQPNDVITNANGDIFVCEGHGDASPARISKFDKNGAFIKAIGTNGTGRGEFKQPHAFAWDSKGRLFVADRSNNRIQILDQDLNVLDVGWEQYSRISGLWIDKDDMLYAADSESGRVAPTRTAWTRGIRIGSIKDGRDGKIRAFIPDPETNPTSTSSAEGVAVDAAGHIYGAEVGQKDLKRYVIRK